MANIMLFITPEPIKFSPINKSIHSNYIFIDKITYTMKCNDII